MHMHLKNQLWTTLFDITYVHLDTITAEHKQTRAMLSYLMFIYIHKYMYKMYYVKVLGNPFDDNFGPFLLNLF